MTETIEKLINGAAVGVCVININSQIVYCNQSFAKLFRYSAVELNGTNINILMCEPQSNLHAICVRNFFGKNHSEFKPITKCTTGITKDGVKLKIEITIFAADNDEKLCSAFVKDVSDDQVKSDEIALLEEKNMFAANISHEIRSPLSTIINMNQLLRDDLEKQENVIDSAKYSTIMDSVECIDRNCHTVYSLINDILDFSALDSGKLTLGSEPLDLIQCIDDVKDIHSLAAQKKRINITSHVDPSVPNKLIGDQLRLLQIVNNLVGNAVKFTHEGEIAINVSLIEKKRKHVQLAFRVSDTGHGIKSMYHKEIFKSFIQVNSGSTRRKIGTGLGLAICKKLCELMDGTIYVESSSEQGTVFKFTVKLEYKRKNTRGIFRKKQRKNSASKKRVMVLDKSQGNIQTITQYLLKSNFDVVPVLDEATALIFIESGGDGFDLILCDAEFEGLANEIRAKVDCKIIAMSFANDVRDVFDGVLLKPITQERSMRHLTKLLTGEDSPRERASPLRIINPQFSGDRGKLSKILIVEDNRDHVLIMRNLLSRFGYNNFAVCYDGLEGYNTIKESVDTGNSFDLVFMDINMPKMTGLECVRRLQDEIPDDRLPVIIALTAVSKYGQREFYVQEVHFDDYLPKPISVIDLQKLLICYLGI